MNNPTNIETDKWSQLVAQCWIDPQFQARLIRDPHAVLREAGITVPGNVKLEVVADSATQRTLVIPTPPPAPGVQDVLQTRKAAGTKAV